jgi:hypothetical protein
MQTHPGAFPRPAAVLALACTGLFGCKGPEVASHNLDQILRPEGGFHYQGNLRGEFEYHLSQMVDNSMFTTGLTNEDPDVLENPTELSLDHLLRLAATKAGPALPLVAATQVRQFARYALLCPSDLARERCFLELAGHGQRLGIEGPLLDIPAPAEPEQVADALGQVVRLHRISVDGLENDSEGVGLAEAYSAACESCAALPLDIHGGWRLLDLVTQIEAVTPPGSPGSGPLRSLSLDLQRHLVALCLTLGADDPSARARAAAWGACHAVYGAPFLAEALVSLVMPALNQEGQQARTQRFGLSAQKARAEEVFLTVFELVRAHGLPSDLPAFDPELLRMSQLFVLVQVAHDFSGYGDRSRISAMQTLGVVVGQDGRGLRKEEWEEWWDAATAALGAEEKHWP